jgi:uncharacterized Tic20 family protein
LPDPPGRGIILTMTEQQESDRTFAIVSHLVFLAGFVVPLGSVLGPMVIWLVKKDESPHVEAHAREALNFQLSMLIYSFILAFMLLTIVLALIAIPGIIVLVILNLVFSIVAAVKASNGEFFRYPLTIRIIKGPA